jgi:serine/threonine protein kinase/CheY-like chemotaxis protein
MSSLEFLREHFFSGVPRYKYLGTLGRGGMGVVYKARDLELEEDIAIKVLFAPAEFDEEALLARFKREVSLNRKIKHPNVARLHDFGTSQHLPYVTMEFVEGRDLGSVIEAEGPLAPDRAVAILRQVALGSDAAHKVGIIHRDLKPQNIMVSSGGAVAILDFGLARGMALRGITLLGNTVGTPHYMSPEQARGKPTDARSDIYSIGVVAFEVLTARIPFDAQSPMAIAIKQVEEPIPMHVLPQHGVPPALADIVHKCLAKKAEERFQSAAELESALALLGPLSVPLGTGEIEVPADPGLAESPPFEEAEDVNLLLESVPGLDAPLPADLTLDLDISGAKVPPISRDANPAAPAEPSAPAVPAPASRSIKRSRPSSRLTFAGVAAVPKNRPPRVLVVDDEPTVRRVMRMALEPTGCEILEAVTGQSALEILHEKDSDLVVMDVQMPILDGFDTARILRSQARFHDLPIVFASGNMDRNRLAFALQSGGTDFIEKPLDSSVLVEKTWRILGHLGFTRAR